MCVKDEVKNVVVSMLPRGVSVVGIECEGPTLVMYIQNPSTLMEQSSIIRSIAKTLRKRIVFRAAPEARLDEEAARKIIYEVVGEEAIDRKDGVRFSRRFGEVYIYLSSPLKEREIKRLEKEIFARTGWKPNIESGMPRSKVRLPTHEIYAVRQILHNEGVEEERRNMLQQLGRRIYRDPIMPVNSIQIGVLGAGQEVGRSSILVRTSESTLLLDCGLKPGSSTDEFPMGLHQLDLDELDGVVVTHAHMDHIACLPYLFKYGYRGPVYMTEPTKYLLYILLTDYVEIARREGRVPPYGLSEVEEVIYHTITLDYEDTTDITPDIKLSLYDAGHEIGSALVHLHVGNGLYNIVYTGDFKYGYTRLLSPANDRFRRLELLIMESTYGGKDDVQPPREESEAVLLQTIRDTVENGGKVLIPVFSTGRAQEILYVINHAIRQRLMPKVKVYVDGMVLETLSVHTMFPQYLNREVSEMIYEGVDPFIDDHVVPVDRAKRLEERMEQVMGIVQGEPSVIMAPHGMLNGGPVLDYFAHLAEDPKNTLVFVSYQAENTLGRRILNGERDFTLRTLTLGETKISMAMNVRYIPGFSGHSDRRELMNYVRRVEPRPQKIMLVHGEPSKAIGLAVSIELKYHVTTLVPKTGDHLRIYPP